MRRQGVSTLTTSLPMNRGPEAQRRFGIHDTPIVCYRRASILRAPAVRPCIQPNARTMNPPLLTTLLYSLLRLRRGDAASAFA